MVHAAIRGLLSLFSPAGDLGKLSILIFHRVLQKNDELFPSIPNEEQFSKLLVILNKNFNVIKLSEAVELLRTGSLPSRSLCITFDDGYMDNYTVAKPILESYKMPATFFIATGFLEGTCMWNDMLIEAVRKTKLPNLRFSHLNSENDVFNMQGIDNKRDSLKSLIMHLKYLPPEERYENILSINKKLEVDVAKNLMMTKSEVKSLANSEMEIGAHTVTHPILSKIDKDMAREEIVKGRSTLESITGKKVSLFAYPNGKPGEDYTQVHRDLCENLGFTAAVSTAWGAANKQTDIYQLPRFTPWRRKEISFLMQMLQNLRRA